MFTFSFFFYSLAGSQELLDSWLTLVSRLVNSDTLMDSVHALPASSTQPGFVPFKPIDFLVATQKVCRTIYNPAIKTFEGVPEIKS